MAVHLLHNNHSQDENHKDNPPILKRNKEVKKNITKSEQKTKGRKRGRPDVGSAFDIFELMSDGDYEDDEEDDPDDEDYYFDGDSVAPKPDASTEGHKVKNEDSSSAEEGADFGAMVVEEETTPTTPPSSSEEDEKEEAMDLADATKNTMAKKRIRIKRRPIDSEEDYDDDDDSGIAGFFRMIFYPVQVAMSRLMDGFASPDEDEDKAPIKGPAITRYPTYTLYHSAHSNEAYAEDDGEDGEDEESSSLSSWFGSWFGLQQRTKKSGATTTTTSPVAPEPTKEAPGWLESWFGFGKTSTTEADTEDDYDSELCFYFLNLLFNYLFFN